MLKAFGRSFQASLPCSLLPLHLMLPFPQPLQNDNNPLPHTMFLPPLSKGGGLTARHKLLSCCVLLATRPPFLFTKLFCRQDGGIAIPSFASHYHSRFSSGEGLCVLSWLCVHCNRGRLRSVRHCLVSHQCRCVLQRLSVADFMHPCIPTFCDHL